MGLSIRPLKSSLLLADINQKENPSGLVCSSSNQLDHNLQPSLGGCHIFIHFVEVVLTSPKSFEGLCWT